ncbi:acyl-CoA thioester hydrolase, YbgC/YbaW family [Bradyrhizobium sp. WSM471]|nr:acyl-CoA thioester hydrolase, YbgC/YbaW family [Bradyrhizobium sp. WSM471]
MNTEADPEGAAARHERDVEKSALVHAIALQRPNEIKKLVFCCDIVKPEFSGIVYHANYLRFMERGRTNHLRLMGAEQQALFEQAETEDASFAFVVRSMHLDFLKPARMDDVLDVVTWPVAVKGASIVLAQEVRRGENVLVKAEVRVAFISGGRAQPIPKSIRALMKADLIS